MSEQEEDALRSALANAVVWATPVNPKHAYNKCHACGSTWWDEGLYSQESHNRGCWVPDAYEALFFAKR